MATSSEDARRTLGPYLAGIAKAIRDGDQLLERILGPDRYRADPRSQASLRNDLVWGRVREEFAGDASLRFERRRGRWGMYIKDEAVVFFKKLDRRYRTMNIPTPTAMQVFGQLEMPGMPPLAPRYVAGWRMDPFNQFVDHIVITYPQLGGVAWHFGIDDGGQSGTGVVEIIPPAPSGQKTPRTRVRPDKEPKQNEGDATTPSG